MKLVKAFVRTSKVNEAIRALEDAGAPGITVSQVHGVGYGYEPMLFTLAPGEMRKIAKVCKIEVVCTDGELEPLLETVVAAARTGDPGDGIVFVTPVERAIKIRTGSTGGEALAAPKGD